ncbi:F0F1 ATP synthase subunit A [Cellulosilyticum sp. I15G10I2]|uniref:F0F1 ATP synthase subunit A n=1 Tax=Cellulosilyticum sp. I15G10I2 TaxID=1892843 RepID=UPI00085BBE1C|nr:F0F1 ATP synthase subunit A [Cellulosilyticum sp. I15G10I2]
MEQNIDFGIKTVVKLFEVDGQAIGITTTHINTWIVMAVLTIIAVIVRIKLNNFKEVPESKLQNIVELIVDTFENFTASTMGKNNKGFSHFYGPMFLFILLSNLSGLVGLRPPTADLATTLALALTTFFMIHGYGIKSKGLSYFKGFLEPMPFLLPINIVGELATPISLSFRLFGNILGGTIIMGLYYAMMPWFLTLGLPAVLHIYFDVFAGALQTLIFVMLSMTFVSSAMD